MRRTSADERSLGHLPAPAARALVWCVAAAVLAGCVPQPRSFVATPGIEPAPAPAPVDPAAPPFRVAILPLANYTAAREAPERVAPMLVAELGRTPGVEVVDAGAVQAALEQEPWLLVDRLPPDLVDKLGATLGAQALLVGSLLAYTSRDADGEQVPQVSLSLRLVETPGGRVLWSAVHSRDGADGEWLFGFGRVRSAEQLAADTVHEMLGTFTVAAANARREALARRGK